MDPIIEFNCLQLKLTPSNAFVGGGGGGGIKTFNF